MDVLENGAQSAFAAFFDIEWHPHSRSLDGKILLPVLGRPFGEALDSGEIKLTFQDGRFFFHYFDSLFPLSPRSYHAILNYRGERLKEILPGGYFVVPKYSGIVASVQELSRGDRRTAKSLPNCDCDSRHLATALGLWWSVVMKFRLYGAKMLTKLTGNRAILPVRFLQRLLGIRIISWHSGRT